MNSTVFKSQATTTIPAAELAKANQWVRNQAYCLGNIKFYIDPKCLNVSNSYRREIDNVCLEHLTELDFKGFPYPAIYCNNTSNQKALFYLRSDYNYRLEWHWRPDNGQQIFTMGVAR